MDIHSGPLAYFRGTWNFEVTGSARADPGRVDILTESDLPLVDNDSAGAQKRPVTSDTSPNDILNAAASGIDSRGLQLAITFDFR